HQKPYDYGVPLNPKFAKVPAQQACELRVRDTAAPSAHCACSTWRHAGGRADIGVCLGGPGLMSWGFLMNQAASSLPQPSSVGGGCCPLQPGLSVGQPIRMWK